MAGKVKAKKIKRDKGNFVNRKRKTKGSSIGKIFGLRDYSFKTGRLFRSFLISLSISIVRFLNLISDPNIDAFSGINVIAYIFEYVIVFIVAEILQHAYETTTKFIESKVENPCYKGIKRHIKEAKRDIEGDIKEASFFIKAVTSFKKKSFKDVNIIEPKEIHGVPIKDVNESLRDLMGIWLGLQENKEPENNIWNVIYKMYLTEECFDINKGVIVTNVEIYIVLLKFMTEYFASKYKSDAFIAIYTTLLPSDWFVKDKFNGKFKIAVIDYKAFIYEFIRDTEKNKGIKHYYRYVAVCKDGVDRNIYYKNITQLEEDVLFAGDAKVERKDDEILQNNNMLNVYLKGMHTEPKNAKYIEVDFSKAENDSLKTNREIILLGRWDNKEPVIEWYINNNMIAGHEALFLTISDRVQKERKIGDMDVKIFWNLLRNSRSIIELKK